MNENRIDKLKEIVVDNCNNLVDISEIQNDSDIIGDLGINSIQFLTILNKIEEAFQVTVEIDDVNIELLSKIDYLNDYISSKLN